MNIKKLDINSPEWCAFVDAHPNSNIFHHPAWASLIADCYSYEPFVLAKLDKLGRVEAGIPFINIVSWLTGRRWVSLPFSDHCCPLYTDESALRKLVEGVIILAEHEKGHSIEFRAVYPEMSALHTSSQYVIHEIDLRPGEENIWKCTHEMHRRNVRIARAHDVEILPGETLKHLEDFYSLHLLTRRRQGVPVQPWKFFKYVKELLLDQKHGFLLLAYRDQQCIAGAIFLHFKEILTYKYGASRDDTLRYRPNNLVMWTAIQWGCEHGFARFDLGRTDPENTGLRTFKSRWGARETPLIYTSLGTNSMPRRKEKLMHYMHIMLRKSPPWVCRLSGEILYRHFG